MLNKTIGKVAHAMAGSRLLACLFVCVLALGCGKSAPELETWPVHGRVVDQKGRPVANGAVRFIDDLDAKLNMAGDTDDDGKYSMRSFRDGHIYEGAVPGTYRVVVICGLASRYELPEPYTVEPKDSEFLIKVRR